MCVIRKLCMAVCSTVAYCFFEEVDGREDRDSKCFGR